MIGNYIDQLKNNLEVDICIYNIDNKNIWGVLLKKTKIKMFLFNF